MNGSAVNWWVQGSNTKTSEFSQHLDCTPACHTWMLIYLDIDFAPGQTYIRFIYKCGKISTVIFNFVLFSRNKRFFWKKDRIERHLDILLPLSTPVFIHLHCTITAWLNLTFIYLNFFHIIEKTGLRSSLIYFWYLHEFDYCILLRLLKIFESFFVQYQKEDDLH